MKKSYDVRLGLCCNFRRVTILLGTTFMLIVILLIFMCLHNNFYDSKNLHCCTNFGIYDDDYRYLVRACYLQGDDSGIDVEDIFSCFIVVFSDELSSRFYLEGPGISKNKISQSVHKIYFLENENITNRLVFSNQLFVIVFINNDETAEVVLTDKNLIRNTYELYFNYPNADEKNNIITTLISNCCFH